MKKTIEKLQTLDILQSIKDKKKKIVKTMSILLIVGIVGVGAVGGALFSHAKSKVNYSEKQMKEIALNKVPGEVLKVKKEFDEDTLTFEYEFKIKDKENVLREVTVNADNGAIVHFDFGNSYNHDDE